MSSVIPQKNLLHTLLLFLLRHKGPSHGYALATCLEEQFEWKTSQTSIYNVLKDLESKAYVSVEEQINNGRIQKTYSISEAGVTFLTQTKHAHAKEFKKIISKLLELIYRYGDNDVSLIEESEFDLVDKLMPKLKQISDISLNLMGSVPDETLDILLAAITSLESLAEKTGIIF